ncbi:MAG: dTMP kinase [Ruminococcus callidus]
MVKQGKIIVLDGLDGCGKSTQFAALGKLLTEQGETVKPISFPMYDKPSAALVKMYLRGDFSDTPDGVNAYAASSFYAVDRYANYKLDWEKNYTAGELILASRYTTIQRHSPDEQAAAGAVGRSTWNGWRIMSTVSWDCPSRIWCCFCPCRWNFPRSFSPNAMTGTLRKKTFTRLTLPIWNSVTVLPAMPAKSWGGSSWRFQTADSFIR